MKRRNSSVFKALFVIIVICIQIYIVTCATDDISVGGDMVFTYTLANNTYSPLWFTENILAEFANSNGWFQSDILKEWYLVNDYNRFDYSGVYWHQRADVHPPLYYAIVHTICSFFPNSYSNMYAGAVNIFGILAIDIILIFLFKILYNNYIYSVLPMILLLLHGGFVSQIFNLRMYIMLSAVCFWYLYIHISAAVNGWTRRRLLYFIVCVIVGCLTHNYFYVYAACVSIIQIIYFIIKKNIYTLANYFIVGCSGIMTTLIIFPWVIWQVIFNQQGKHTDIYKWDLNSIRNVWIFVDEYMFNKNGAFILGALFVCCLGIYFYKKHLSLNLNSPHIYIYIYGLLH